MMILKSATVGIQTLIGAVIKHAGQFVKRKIFKLFLLFFRVIASQ